MVTFGDGFLHSAQLSWDLSHLGVGGLCLPWLGSVPRHGNLILCWIMTHQTMSAASLAVPKSVTGGVHVQILGGNTFITTRGQMPRGATVGSYANNKCFKTVKLDSGMVVTPYFKYGISYISSIATFATDPQPRTALQLSISVLRKLLFSN